MASIQDLSPNSKKVFQDDIDLVKKKSNEIGILKGENAAKTEEIRTLQDRVESLEATVKAQGDKIKRLQRDLNDLNQRIVRNEAANMKCNHNKNLVPCNGDVKLEWLNGECTNGHKVSRFVDDAGIPTDL